MFLFEYNQRHKGASLVHHCHVQLCQRRRDRATEEEEKTESPGRRERAGRETRGIKVLAAEVHLNPEISTAVHILSQHMRPR